MTATTRTRSREGDARKRPRGMKSRRCYGSGRTTRTLDSRSRRAVRLGLCFHRERRRRSAGGQRSAPLPRTGTIWGRPETPERNEVPEMLRQWKDYKNSGFKKPPGSEAGALFPPGTEEAKCWWAKISTIAENGYNLGAGRYKPRVAEKAPEEDPAELIRRTLEVELSIAMGLEKLLKEVEAVK